MSKTCEKCGTDLSDRASFCPACGKAQSGMPRQIISVPIKKGPLILPETRLSLWAAILVMIGAVSFCCNWITAAIINKNIGSVLWLIEVLLFIGMAILLFASRKASIPLLIPLLIWSVGALFEVIIYTSVTFMQNLELIYPIISACLALTLMAVIFFTALFVLRIMKKQKVIIVIGILFTVFLSSGIFININDLFLSINSDPHIGFTLRYLLMSFYYLTISLGIFLTILAAKEKQAVPIIGEPAGK